MDLARLTDRPADSIGQDTLGIREVMQDKSNGPFSWCVTAI
jgi:hypothetical protein